MVVTSNNSKLHDAHQKPNQPNHNTRLTQTFLNQILPPFPSSHKTSITSPLTPQPQVQVQNYSPTTTIQSATMPTINHQQPYHNTTPTAHQAHSSVYDLYWHWHCIWIPRQHQTTQTHDNIEMQFLQQTWSPCPRQWYDHRHSYHFY